MGFRYGTKDYYERETEEAERLVRPAPKVKPKRTDLRRERANPDRDPDIDDDKDTKKDPDLSMNYKTIGGSIGGRVVARFLTADIDRSSQSTDRIRVRHRETGNITYVKPETLKEESGKYEAAEEEAEEEKSPPKQEPTEEKKPEKSGKEPEESPEDKAKLDYLRSIRTRSRKNPEFANAISEVMGDGEVDVPGETPMLQFPELWKFKPFRKFNTIGELRDHLTQNASRDVVQKLLDEEERQENPEVVPKQPESEKAPEPEAKPPVPEQVPQPAPEDKPEVPKEEPKPKKELPKKKEPIELKRRSVSQGEQDRAKMHIIESFPPEVARNLLAQNLHPDDVTELMSAYHLTREAKPKTIEEAADLVGGSYETNPAKVKPPRFGKNKDGQEVPFDELDPEDQAEALQKHRIRTVAISLAAREGLVSQLESKTKAPEVLLGKIADFALTKNLAESPEQRTQRALESTKSIFQDTLSAGLSEVRTSDPRFQNEEDEDSEGPAIRPVAYEMSRRQVEKLLDTLKEDPGSQQIAVGFLQAADYLEARKSFLDSPDGISEYQTPRQIWQGLQRANAFFERQSDRYPPKMRWVNTPESDFRFRVLDKIKTFAPEKYPFLARWNEKLEDEEYDRRVSEWGSQFSDEDKTAPPKPNPPLGYDQRHGNKKERKSQRQQLLDEHRRQLGAEPTPEPPSGKEVQASSVVSRFLRFSSYPWGVTMANGKSKQAVYWGVEPYPKGHEGFAPYTKWTQAHQRDLTSADYDSLLSAARSWLKAPVLSKNIDGIVRDTQLRAALDLAIRDHADGKYAGGFHPDQYNKLLARLAGESQSETLLTVHAAVRIACGCASSDAHDSVYVPPGGEEPPMKASATIRTFAASAASTNPKFAYELLELADKVAEQEQQAPAEEQKQAGEVPPQFLENMKKKEEEGKKDESEGQDKKAYSTLKSVVIKMAHANPHLREAYLPILQAIKELG